MNILKRNRNILNYLKKKISKIYLKEICRKHIKIRYQPVVFSFDFISQSIFIEGRFEDSELNFIEKNFKHYLDNKIILDIGANIGNHTIAFSKYAKKVYAFEPNKKVFEVLKLNTDNIKNVEIFNYGASSKKQSIIAKIPKLNCGGGSIDNKIKSKDKNNFHKSIFKLIPLDKFNQIQNKKISLIKIDIEGHELQAFKGMKFILKKNKPIILFEQNREIFNGGSEVISFLKSVGYNNLYELKKVDNWILKKYAPKIFKFVFEFIEVLIIGEPINKLKLKSINNLTKKSYDMLVMSCSKIF